MRSWLPCFVLLCIGCDDLEDFRTGPSDVFHGVVIGSGDQTVIVGDGNEVSAEAEQGESFIRQGFESYTELELTFDPELADTYAVRDAGAGGTPVPGTINTYICNDEDSFCAESKRVQGDFDHAPLEPFPSLAHDLLSQYTFPGGVRKRNYIFSARFTTNGAPRFAMVFVSLMDSGKVEVRIVSPGVLDATDPAMSRGLFGVFSLSKRQLP